jgi:hypothetical protein
MNTRRITRFFNLVAATALSAVLAVSASAPASATGIIILPTSGVVSDHSHFPEMRVLPVWTGIIILPTSG